jgi:hypothetical protein
LESNVNLIAQELKNGIRITKDNIDEWNEVDVMYEIGDMVNGHDYLANILDITYKVNSNRVYKSAELLVAFGGPNIYIDTHKREVQGYWGSDKFISRYWTDPMDIDEVCEEMYQQAG